MPLDQVTNFVRGQTDAAVNSTQTTISVVDATIFPDPVNGEYNLVFWDADSHPRPDEDPDVEIVRVTARDTTNNDLTVTRGQESTAGAAHPNPSAMQLAPTEKMFTDIETDIGGKLSLDGSDTMSGILDLGANDLEDGTQKIWDASIGEIPDSALGTIESSTIADDYVFNSGDTITGTLTASGSPAIDASNDIRLATGQSIEDGSGTNRVELDSGFTGLNDQQGNIAFFLQHGSRNAIKAWSDTPFNIKDEEGGFQAVQYDTDPSAGVLRTPNAGVRVESNLPFSSLSGKGIELSYSNSSALVSSYDRSIGSHTEMRVQGSPLNLAGKGGLVDMSVSPANLRLATGQSIEDGSGTQRMILSSGQTQIRTQNGNNAISIIEGAINQIHAYSDTPVGIRDMEGGFTGVQYKTDASTGTLELTNATLDANQNEIENAVIDNRTTDPTGAVAGQMWYRTDLD